jgi:hypothetical protein
MRNFRMLALALLLGLASVSIATVAMAYGTDNASCKALNPYQVGTYNHSRWNTNCDIEWP